MNIYFDAEHPASYGGVHRLAHAAGATRRATMEWLRAQLPYTLHKPVRKRYSTRPYKTSEIDQHWQGDLVEMIPYANVNDGYRYILTLIDLFSRYAWAVSLRDKTANDVAAAFRQVFAQGRQPQRLQTDDGREFDNRVVQHFLNIENIRFFTELSLSSRQLLSSASIVLSRPGCGDTLPEPVTIDGLMCFPTFSSLTIRMYTVQLVLHPSMSLKKTSMSFG